MIIYEMSLSSFLAKYPYMKNEILKYIDDIEDEFYIIRYESANKGRFEIGYRSDVWVFNDKDYIIRKVS